MEKIVKNNKKYLKIIGVAIAFIAIAGYLYFKSTHKVSEDIRIINQLQKIISFQEKPEVTTITDLSIKEYDPDLYKDLKVGDKIVQFKYGALIYDYRNKKILNVLSDGALFKEEIKPMLVAIRYNKGQEERAIAFKNGIASNFPQLSFTDLSSSSVVYPSDVIYLVNKNRKDDAIRFSQQIGNSPIIDVVDPSEKVSAADIIVAFSNYQPTK